MSNRLHHKTLQGATHIEQTRDLLPFAGARAASRPLLRQRFEIDEKQLLNLLQTCEVMESNVKEISEDPKTIHTFLCSKTKRFIIWILT